MPTAISAQGFDFLVKREGCKLAPYRDSAGLWTIGVGHLLHPTELAQRAVMLGGEKVPFPLTEEQARALCRQDVAHAEAGVSRLVSAPLTTNQADALISFTFNVGTGLDGLAGSTLLRRLNARDYLAVPMQMRRWIHSGGKVDHGLENRREYEVHLWLGDWDGK
jgi:lysozyme